MKVRMKVTVSGTIDGARSRRGDELDVADAVGKHLCEQGYAEPVAAKPADKAERRVVQAPETREQACPEDGCDYEGSAQGLKIHTARSH